MRPPAHPPARSLVPSFVRDKLRSLLSKSARRTSSFKTTYGIKGTAGKSDLVVVAKGEQFVVTNGWFLPLFFRSVETAFSVVKIETLI